MTRAATGFRVGAFLRLCAAQHIPAYVLHRGDDTAGAVVVKIARLDGTARVLARGFALEGEGAWAALQSDDPAPEADCDAYIARRRATDGDLWVIEVELRDGEPPLDDL